MGQKTKLKVYMSKSNHARPDHYARFIQEMNDMHIVDFSYAEGGGVRYDPRNLEEADVVVVFSHHEAIVQHMAFDEVYLGKGTYGEANKAFEMNKYVFVYDYTCDKFVHIPDRTQIAINDEKDWQKKFGVIVPLRRYRRYSINELISELSSIKKEIETAKIIEKKPKRVKRKKPTKSDVKSTDNSDGPNIKNALDDFFA